MRRNDPWPDWSTEDAQLSPVALVVLEQRGTWAGPLRHAVGGIAVPFRETRSPTECLEVLAGHPASVVCVELGRRQLPLLDTLVHEGPDRFPSVRWVVLVRRWQACDAATWSELGASYVTVSPRQLTPVRSIVERQMLEHPAPKVDRLTRWWLPAEPATRPSPGTLPA